MLQSQTADQPPALFADDLVGAAGSAESHNLLVPDSPAALWTSSSRGGYEVRESTPLPAELRDWVAPVVTVSFG